MTESEICASVAAFDCRGRVTSHSASFFVEFPAHALPALSAAVLRLQSTSLERKTLQLGNRRVVLQRLTGVEPVFVATVDRLPPAWVPLSPRQREIAKHAAMGATAVEIAATLKISTHTVRQHLKEVYRRLGVGNRIQLSQTLAEV